MRVVRFGLLLMLASGLPAATTNPSARSVAKPSLSRGAPLYLAQHGRSKVYIQGACAGEDESWLSDRSRKALAESTDFWRELPIDDIDKASIDYSDRIGTLDHGNLFNLLDATETKRVESALKTLDVARERIAPTEIWYGARILTFASYAKSGRPVGQPQDPELVLTQLAIKQHKTLHAESPNWNAFADFYDKMPIAVQKQYLSYSLDDIETPPAGILAGYAACGRGDPSYFEAAANAFARRYPALYGYLNGQRDAEWARKINGFLANGGVHFIVVGMNHAVGPRSIQSELAKIGIATRRL